MADTLPKRGGARAAMIAVLRSEEMLRVKIVDNARPLDIKEPRRQLLNLCMAPYR